MITRVWHGRTKLAKADEYLDFLLHDGTREYLETDGNLSVKIWQRKEVDFCHFWTVSEWSDIKSIKSFAGDDYEKAKYYPQDDGFLVEFEEKVIHYETYPVKILPS
jgi:hypothetical protein